MTNIPLEIGQQYKVQHASKGTFTMKVMFVNEDWVSGILTDGVADALLAGNIKYENDAITVRNSLSIFSPLEGAK